MICDQCADMADWQDGRDGAIAKMAAVGHVRFCVGRARGCDCQHRPIVQPSRYELLYQFRLRRMERGVA